MAPKQERVLGRLLLAAVALLLVDVDLDLLNLEEQEDNDQAGVAAGTRLGSNPWSPLPRGGGSSVCHWGSI